jgi:uncharacterized membrane protein YqjE
MEVPADAAGDRLAVARDTPARSVAAERAESSLLDPVERTIAALRALAGDFALLAVLDLRRAALQLAWLVGAGIVASVLVVTAWLAGVTAVVVWLLGAGVSWPVALIIAGLLNLVGAALVAWRMHAVIDEMPFAATLRQLKAKAPAGESK